MQMRMALANNESNSSKYKPVKSKKGDFVLYYNPKNIKEPLSTGSYRPHKIPNIKLPNVEGNEHMKYPMTNKHWRHLQTGIFYFFIFFIHNTTTYTIIPVHEDV
jgi:hypothetical protein